MANTVKFKSPWGEFDVDEDKVHQPEPTNRETNEEDISPKSKDTEEDTNKGGDTGDDSQKNKAPESSTNTSEEDEYEFTGDDVSKAYTMLYENGVLNLTEEEEQDLEESPSGLSDAVALTIRKGVQEELQKTPLSVQKLYTHLQNGGTEADFEFDLPTDWENFDISSEDSKETAYREYLSQEGWSEADIVEELNDAKESGKLEKKALFAVEKLSKTQADAKAAKAAARAKVEKEAQDARDKEIEELEKFIDETEEIASFKLDDKKRQGFKDYLFKINKRTGKTQMQENMNDESRKITIAFLDYINYNKADLEKEVASNLTKMRKKTLQKITDKNVKNSNSSAVVKTKQSGKGKIKFPTIFGSQNIEVED